MPLGFHRSSAIAIATVAGAGAGAVAGATPRVALSTASTWVRPGAPAHVAEARRASEAAMATLADDGAAPATAPASAPVTAPAADGEGGHVPKLGHAAGGAKLGHAAGGAVLSLRAAGRLGDRPSAVGRTRAVVGTRGGADANDGVPNLVSSEPMGSLDPLADCRELFVPSRCHTAAQQTVLRRAAAVLHAENGQRVTAAVVAALRAAGNSHVDLRATATKLGSELKSGSELKAGSALQAEGTAAARGASAAARGASAASDDDDDDDDEDDEDDDDDDDDDEEDGFDEEEGEKPARIPSHTGADSASSAQDSASSAAVISAAIAFAPPSWDIRWRSSAALSAAADASDQMPEGRCDLFNGGWRTNGLGDCM